MLNLCIRVTMRVIKYYRRLLKLTINRGLLVGKGETMPKRNVNRQLKLTESEQLLDALHRIVKSGSEKAGLAQNFIAWWLANQSWTPKQLAYIKAIVRNEGKPKKPKQKKYHLYAVRSGSSIKIGFSSNVKLRLKSMQTGQPVTLKVEWTYYVGRSITEARKAERKLHRLCKKYSVRGEWFRDDCITLIKQFALMETLERDYGREHAEASIVANANKFI